MVSQLTFLKFLNICAIIIIIKIHYKWKPETATDGS